MKKRILTFLLMLLLLGPSLTARERKEVVVLFDTSVSVLPIYDDLTSLVLRGTLDNQIQRGDSFHLLSFAENPIYEFSQDIREEKDRERIRNYMEVLKPMGLHTDLIMALNFLYSFTQDLSINTRKTILILTDGIHDPPPEAPSYGRGQEYVERSLREITDKINRQGWSVRILQLNAEGTLSQEDTLGLGTVGSLGDGDVPDSENNGTLSADNESGGSSSDGENYLNLMSKELKAPVTPFDQQEDQENLANRVMGVTRLAFPEELGEVGRSFIFPMEITNYGKLAVAVNLQGIHWRKINLLKDKLTGEIPPGEPKTFRAEIRLPEDMAPGTHSLELDFLFADGQKVFPSGGMVSLTLGATKFSRFDPMTLYAGGALLLVVLIIVSAVLIRRHIERTVSDDDGEKAKVVSTLVSGEKEGAVDSFVAAKETTAKGGRIPSQETSLEKVSREKQSKIPLMPAKKEPTKEDWKVVKAGGNHSANEPWGALGAIEMKVDGQNPHLGHGNIRIVKENSSIIVGGKGAPYQIFLYPVSSRLAELSYDGREYTLTPLLKDAFPGLNGPLKGCLNSWIPLKSTNGKVLRIKFIHWASPLERLNWLMHIIDHPGIPKKWY